MAERYSPNLIETKWQKIWEEEKTFKVDIDPTKKKYYVLDMFPYPSGAGLHVGHVTGYAATDVIARYKRQKGFNVLHPMGWDSFGLPAEQYAIRTGVHPQKTTEKNISTYRSQLKALGFSYDWSREFATSSPDYYKWTQWIFTKLFEKGLAYEDEALVNFCPKLGTVVANEEIEDGKTVIGGYPVERRPLRQWMLKITAYAERLLEDLEDLDWPEQIKKAQAHWIGKSTGVEIAFTEEKTGSSIPVYTTRHDTLFGITYLALAPEHPLIDEITEDSRKEAVLNYKQEAAKKSDLARTDLAKDKSGVFTGAYAIEPVTQKRIPIWIADYVLWNVGTGAVMGVPAHCNRDHEFAKQYDVPIVEVIQLDPDQDIESYGIVINSKNDAISLNGLSSEEAKEKLAGFIESKGYGKRRVNYRLRDWLFSRQRYWGEPIPVFHLEDEKRPLDLDELPLCPPHLEDFTPKETGESPLAKVHDWVHFIDPKTGKKALKETNTMPQWAGSCWYYLRFCDPKNASEAWSKEAENYWMPVDLYVGGAEHAVLHLLYARFWHKVLYDCGYVSTKEPFQSLRNQGLVVAHSYKKHSGAYVSADHVIEKEGKFYEKDAGFDHPLIQQIEKMSKSKLNGVTPDEMIEEFGADALRLYELFMSPFDREKMWDTKAILGSWRFLNRFWELCLSPKVVDKGPEEKDPKCVIKEGMRLGLKLTHDVTTDIEQMQFNTAIAKMMEFLNHFGSLEFYPKKAIKCALQCLHPFAPHITSELWERVGFSEKIHELDFEKVSEKDFEEQSVKYVVQVNGKHRATLDKVKGLSEADLTELVKSDERLMSFLSPGIIKVIYVPNKLINFVVKR